MTLEQSVAGIGHTIVGFVDIRGKQPGPAGSGTLMRFGPVFGVLTCAHVALEIGKHEAFGIVCFTAQGERLQGPRINVADTDVVVLGGPPYGARGPDLAFVRLAPNLATSLAALASIVDGELIRTRCLTPEPTELVSNVASGVIGDWTSEPKQVTTKISKTTFNGFTKTGSPVAYGVVDEEYDLLDFKLWGAEQEGHPENYKGMSGGSIWRLYVEDDEDTVIETRLVGVMFFETEDRHIICHGVGSIFVALYDKMRERWADFPR